MRVLTHVLFFSKVVAQGSTTVTNAAAIEAWMQKDVDARTYLYSTIKYEQQTSLHGCDTASSMWTRIQTEFAQAIADNAHLMTTRFFEYKYRQGNSVMSHVAAIEQMAAHLKNLNAPISDVQVMSKILHTLPPSYRHFLSAWDNVSPADKTIKLLISRLVNEETRTKEFNDGAADPRDLAFFAGQRAPQQPEPAHAFPAQGNGQQGGRGGFRGGFRRGQRGRRGGNHGGHCGNLQQ